MIALDLGCALSRFSYSHHYFIDLYHAYCLSDPAIPLPPSHLSLLFSAPPADAGDAALIIWIHCHLQYNSEYFNTYARAAILPHLLPMPLTTLLSSFINLSH